MTRNQIIEDILIETGAKAYRFEQAYELVYKSEFKHYSKMISLPEDIREKLSERLGDEVLTLEEKVTQKGDQTQKILFETSDKNPVETVKMHYEGGRNTYCVSSQSGCAMNCAFCATGQMGLKRNLSADEIVDQVLYFRKNGQEIDNVVFMGMGEPFLNPETFKSLDILTDQRMFNLGHRRISVSTVGIIPGIKTMTQDYPQINLTFSLHTPFQKQREELVPIAKSYPVHSVMDALANHIQETNRKVLIAYLLIGGITDTKAHAIGLAGLIKEYPKEAYLFHVNLINYHEIPGKTDFKKASQENTEVFREILHENGIRSTVRQDFGEHIDAACGQLSGGRDRT